jgi:hypothetical protein
LAVEADQLLADRPQSTRGEEAAKIEVAASRRTPAWTDMSATKTSTDELADSRTMSAAAARARCWSLMRLCAARWDRCSTTTPPEERPAPSRPFAHDANLARTAAARYVHVNTVYQRLERIRSLRGTGWRSGDGALQVQLALKLHRVPPTI